MGRDVVLRNLLFVGLLGSGQPTVKLQHSSCYYFPLMSRRDPSTLLFAAALMMFTLGALAADEIGQPAPRFRAKTTAGEKFDNTSVKGKVVLFEFWTSWCKYCGREAEIVDDIAKEFANQGLIVLAVDVLEPDQTVKKYLADHPRSVPVVLTKDTNLAAMYNAQRYPIYVLIDRDGNIAGEQRGAWGERGLRQMLKRVGLETKEGQQE